VTYGPIGRVAWTLALVVPIVFGVFYSIFFLVAAATWAFVVPVALRDVWRAVRDPTQAPALRLPSHADPPVPGEGIQDRRPPSRW
jgi:hypothetical protein